MIKTQLIKLGSEKPELRPHIRPILHVIANRPDWPESRFLEMEYAVDGMRKTMVQVESALVRFTRSTLAGENHEVKREHATREMLELIAQIYDDFFVLDSSERARRNASVLRELLRKFRVMSTDAHYQVEHLALKSAIQRLKDACVMMEKAVNKDPDEKIMNRATGKVLQCLADVYENIGTVAEDRKADLILSYASKFR